MLVKNVEPRLIVVNGVMIAPNAEVEVDENAGGLSGLIERGVLVEIKPTAPEKPEEPESGKKVKAEK